MYDLEQFIHVHPVHPNYCTHFPQLGQVTIWSKDLLQGKAPSRPWDPRQLILYISITVN